MLQKVNILGNDPSLPNVIEINNMGHFLANFIIKYTLLDGKNVTEESGVFSMSSSKKISIPLNARDIHVVILTCNWLGQWTPIYNNNYWNDPVTLSAKLYGTIFNPQLEVLSDSKPPEFQVSVTNISGFVCNYILKYTFNANQFSIDSNYFTLGMTRFIALPKTSSNINIVVNQIVDPNLPNQSIIYTKNTQSVINMSFIVSGTSNAPKVEELI